MHDPIHASNEADHGLAEAEKQLVAADAADMHRLLAWYYGARAQRLASPLPPRGRPGA